MKFLKWLGIILLILIIVYFLGPQPDQPVYETTLPAISATAGELDDFVKKHESQYRLKPDNEARIIWANDSSKSKTPYSVVYLHGFSASHEEGNPLHRNFAKRYGCNLFLSRLYAHGIASDEPLGEFRADSSWESAKEALVIARQLGEKVIIMSTSTGGTLALKLAAEYPDIAGLILLSPNIAINDPNAWLLNNHWGLQIAHLVEGRFREAKDTTAVYAKYWNNKYLTSSLVQLEELLETTMKEPTFKKVTQPVLLLYYYQDEDHQDDVVKVSAMKRMFSQLGTPETSKRQIAIPRAGDHVIGSSIKSRDVNSVESACHKFAEEVLRLKPNE